MSKPSSKCIQEAITAYQDNSDGVSPATLSMLKREFEAIWRKIQQQPDSYTMNNTEFRIFNALRPQSLQNDDRARRAAQRYWDSRRQ